MDNPVTGLNIKYIQPNYCNLDHLFLKSSKIIIVVPSLWLYWETFNTLEYFNPTTCLMICYITIIDKKWIICNKSWYLLHFYRKPGNYTLKLVSAIFYQIFISHQMIAPQKIWKMFFISSKKLFSFLRYSCFCIFVFPPFSPC